MSLSFIQNTNIDRILFLFLFFFLVWTTSSSLSGNNILFRDASWKLFCTYILNYFWFFVYFCVRHTSFFFHLLLKVDAFSGLFSNSPPTQPDVTSIFIYLFIILCLPSLILPTLCIIRIIFGLFVCLIFFSFSVLLPSLVFLYTSNLGIHTICNQPKKMIDF